MKLIIYTDGASRGNPGHAAYGFVIFDENKKLLYQAGKYIGITTNNMAEYTAVLQALKHVKKMESRIKNQELGDKQFEIQLFADSKLVAEQLSGRFKVKSSSLKPIIAKIKILAQEMGGVTFSHIPRRQNTLADQMANKALDNKLP